MAYYQGGRTYNPNGQNAQPPQVPPRPPGYRPYSINDDKANTEGTGSAGVISPFSGPQHGDMPHRAPYPIGLSAPSAQYSHVPRATSFPYLPESHDPMTSTQHNQSYSYRHPAETPSYNPQEYARASPTAPQYQPFTPHIDYGNHTAALNTGAGFQQYNPASYHDSGITQYANRLPGPSSTSPVTGVQYQPVSRPGGVSPSQYSSYNSGPSQPEYLARYSSDSPANPSHGYAAYSPPTRATGTSPSTAQYQNRTSPSHYPPTQGALLSPTTSNQSFFNSPSPEIRDETSPLVSPGQIPPPAHPAQAGYFADPQSASPSRAPVPPRHSPQRTESQRHPQAHALPALPSDSDIQPDPIYFPDHPDDLDEEALDELARERLFNDTVNAISAWGTTSPVTRHDSQRRLVSRFSTDAQLTPTMATFSDPYGSERANGPRVNGYPLSTQSGMSAQEDDYEYDSDAEADEGLAAMRRAEEQENADRQRTQASVGATRREQFGDQSRMGAGVGATRHERFPDEEEESFGENSADIDYGETGVDMSSFDGGIDPQMSYGGTPVDLMVKQEHSFDRASRHQSGTSTHSALQNGDPVRTSSNRSMGEPSRWSYGNQLRDSSMVRVDYDGTGGLADPTMLTRKLSFDEGDERPYLYDDTTPDGVSENIPDFAYYPPSTVSRPLPAPPDDYSALEYGHFIDPDIPQSSGPLYPEDPSHYAQFPSALGDVTRATSFTSHSNSPVVTPPIRAKTDAEERKRQSMNRPYGSETDYSHPASRNTPVSLGLDLPTIPVGRRFQPSKLTQRDFDGCEEPWALTSIVSWLRLLAEGETELKQNAIVDALTRLFSNKVPTMSVADTETLVSRVVSEMFEAGTLVEEEEWLKFGSDSTSGVLYQLTGLGCYSPKAHESELQGRCYSHHCQRTLRKIVFQGDEPRNREGWAAFYKMTKEDYENFDKKEVERQNVLHEIVQTEDHYMEQLTVLQLLYREALVSAQPPIIPHKRMRMFERDVFGKLDAVRNANQEYLLPQLKYKQKEQGPWITGFSDIFRDWIRKAKTAYIDYAAAFPNANSLVRQEDERNMLFRSFLEAARNNPLSNRLSWETYLKAPITRLQRYSLLLATVHKNMVQDSEEKTNLGIAIEEIRTVTLDCDTRVAEASRKVDLSDLSSRLILRPEMRQVELNLSHLGRQLIFKGDLQRIGTNLRVTWVDVHAMLFDHYLVLAKTVHRSNAAGIKSERYDVSKMPIPMDLLILESTNDDPVIKAKGIAGVTSATAKAGTPVELKNVRHNSMQAAGLGSLTPVSTNSSTNSTASSASNKTLVPTTNLEREEKILYPFRVKHLGKEVYTLFASSASNRTDWCQKIIEAKTKHAAALFAQNAEPFRLRVMADSAFAYDTASPGHGSILIKGTPLSRAIDEVENAYVNTGRPVPICRARVNCATTFVPPSGKQMVAVGSDYGVFMSEIGNPRGWSRVITIGRVTQIAVLEEFNLFLLISDKSLIAYHLDVVCPSGGRDLSATSSDESNRKAPQKLSGAKDVGFFVTGRMKDRTLVFYKKRDGMSSIFKVLEPVLHKSASAGLARPTSHRLSSFANSLHRGSAARQGTTDFFREYDDFYIPTDCNSISLFNSSLSVSTSKGFEILNLDKKTPWSIPDLKPPHVATIAARLSGCDPIGMFRLTETSSHQRNTSGVGDTTLGHNYSSYPSADPTTSSSANSEFLCVYTECAVYVNKHGDISRSVVMEFVGRARAAALYGPYLLLFDQDFIEIRNAQNGRLKQVVAGRDVKLLDDGRGAASPLAFPAGATTGLGAGLADPMLAAAAVPPSPRTIKIVMQHPKLERLQIILELLLNEVRGD